MTESDALGLAKTLEQAKQEMVRLSGRCAVTTGEWDRAQSLLQWARELDGMILGLKQNGSSTYKAAAPAPRPARPSKLPYYFVEDDKLVKVGPSRDGGTYEHRVVRKNFDLITQRLMEMSRTGTSFETPDLVNRCDIPKHEPLIVLAVMEEQGLLLNVRRGRWSFSNAASFASDVLRVWTSLPRH